MKRVIILVLSAVLIILLVGCASRDPVVLYKDEYVTVTQTGRITDVLDRTTGKTYTFTQHRVKRPQNAAEAEQRMIARTAVDTDTITIQTVHDMLIVTVKDKQTIIHHYYIQP